MTVQLPRNNRQRFKTAVYSVLAAHLAFLLVLLAQGYQSEFTVAARSLDPAEAPSEPTDQLAAAESNSTANPNTAAKAALAPSTAAMLATSAAKPSSPRLISKESTVPAPSAADTFYTVKSGDTLMQVARLHGTTVKVLKAANSLTSERLAIGSKLRIPATKVSSSHE